MTTPQKCNRFHPEEGADDEGRYLPCVLDEDHVSDHEATDRVGKVHQWKRETCGLYVGDKRCSRMPGHEGDHKP